MFVNYLKILTSRNSIILLLLGFSSGLPLALTTGTLQAWMTVENIDLKTIGFFSLVGQAYVLKFFWSPLMDRYTPPFLGRRRGWLISTQILLAVTIFAIGFFKPQNHLVIIAILAIAIAFFSASQDIVFDAYKTDLLKPEERGHGAAISVLGYRIAMLVSGGVALWIATKWLNWHQTYWLMGALMLIGVIATLCASEPKISNINPLPKTLEQAIFLPLKEFFSRNNAWLILLLIIFYKLGDAFAASLSTSFLIRGIGFTADQVGLVNKTLGLLATIVGALFAGILMQRISLFKALMYFGILQGISNIGYWILSITAKNIVSMGGIIFIENLCGGMGTAAFVALLMTLCNRSFSATQFALLSALSAIGRVYVGPIAGWFVESYDWPTFYLFSIIAALPGLILLIICKETITFTNNSQSFLRRIHYKEGYSFALKILGCGALLILITLLNKLFTYLQFQWATFNSSIESYMLQMGIFLSLIGLLLGSSLDYLSLRKQS